MIGVNWARGESRGYREEQQRGRGFGEEGAFQEGWRGGGGRCAGFRPAFAPVPLAPQLAGLFSCVVVLSVMLWLGPLFYYLPKVSSGAGGRMAGRAATSPRMGVVSLPPLP